MLPDVLARMRMNGVGAAVCIGVNLEDLPRVIALAEGHDNLFATVGVHPEYTDTAEPTEDMLCELARHPKIIAIGETGLDYYWQKDAPEWQRERFRTHIRAARRSGLPLVIHTREAAADTLRVMKEEGADAVGGVMHCFTETWEVASAALDLGFQRVSLFARLAPQRLALWQEHDKAELATLCIRADDTADTGHRLIFAQHSGKRREVLRFP